jgi:hypothetical protein
MSLGKRHIGRRVAGVGVAVALMVLGLEAPAFAVLGPITFAPASGPTNCVIVITGTDFQGPDVDVVEIGGSAATFEIQSDTEIWAAANGSSGFVTVEKTATGESVSSTSQFTDTGTAAGTCASTITSFLPTCGTVGTTVTITGTNLISSNGTTFTGAGVEFSPFTGTTGIAATHTGAAESPTTLSVLVPSGAKTGPISVTTAVGEIFSAADFTVVTDPALCVPVGPTTHARGISFKITKAGNASGVVKSTEDPAFTDCVANVPVKIQRKKSGAWKTVGKTTTNDSGAYTKKVKNPKGTQKFRALAPKVSLGDPVTDTCLKARSAVRKK